MNNVILKDDSKCSGCGICVLHCPQMVYEKNENKIPTIAHKERCFGCFACEDDCPEKAIKILRLPEGMDKKDVPPAGAKIDFDKVYDLVIIGGGPAGCGAALRGRMLGLNVLVLERLPSNKRSHHPDGGVLMPNSQVYEIKETESAYYIEDLNLYFSKKIQIENLKDFWLMGPKGQKTASFNKEWEGFIVVDKNLFMQSIIAEVLRRGAIFCYNTRAKKICDVDENGFRSVIIDDDKEVKARIVISAEGHSGKLTQNAGLPVNEFPIGWSYSPYAYLKRVKNPKREAGFMTNINKTQIGPIPYLSYISDGETDLHIANGPLHKKKHRLLDYPITDDLFDFINNDFRVKSILNEIPNIDNIKIDGCRVFVRKIPRKFVADSLIAVGDTITASGMITNLLALKTGDIAAQVAYKAIEKGDLSAKFLSSYEKKIRKIKMFSGMSWMSKMLMEAPLELNLDNLNYIYDTLKPLALGKTQAGEILPILAFYLKISPKLIFKPLLRKYLT